MRYGRAVRKKIVKFISLDNFDVHKCRFFIFVLQK